MVRCAMPRWDGGLARSTRRTLTSGASRAISAGPVIESFEDRLELIASGQAIAVLPVGDRRRSLRADLATVPVEGLPPAWVAGLALS
jgi:hypothetical protein